MGCGDCKATLDQMRRDLEDENRYSTELAGALARVNELVTERATDPSPLGAKELDLMVAIRDVLHDLVQPVVSRETEPDVQTEIYEVEKTRNVPQARRLAGQGYPSVNRKSADGLGYNLQPNGLVSFAPEVQLPRRAIRPPRNS